MTTTNAKKRPLIEYQEVTDPKTIQRIKKRYQASIDAFGAIGIHDIRYVQEKTPPLGWITYCLMVIVAIKDRPLLGADKLLSLYVYYPILFVADECTFIDLSSGSGFSFYTRMKDGEWCISKSHPQLKLSDAAELPYWNTYPVGYSERDAWDFHKAQLASLHLKGVDVDKDTKMDDWMILSHQLDERNRGCIQLLGTIFLLFLVYVSLGISRGLIYKIWPDFPDWMHLIWWVFWITFPWVVAIRVQRHR